jgi:flagellar P-ring protein precursor FlgI
MGIWPLAVAILGLGWLPSTGLAERIKDIASIGGVRSNQLVGYGLVVGLAGSGDQTTQVPFTSQSLRSYLQRLGVSVPAGVNLQVKNVAAVAVHGDLPPFAKPGQTIDVTVSSIGNAQSLRGGSLLMTPLRGADGQVYAMAQGNVVVGGFSVSTEGGSSVTRNVPSTGRIANGATVERPVPTPFATGGELVLHLHSPDYTTVRRIVEVVNTTLGRKAAQPVDAAAIRVQSPSSPAHRVAFVSILENLEVVPGEAPARVIVNSRTGTVVIGRHVRVMAAAVSHGDLTVTVSSQPIISQPAPFSAGQTTVAAQETVTVGERSKPMFLFGPGVSLDEIVKAVNRVGAKPSDLVAILEALKAAGALRAELIVI